MDEEGCTRKLTKHANMSTAWEPGFTVKRPNGNYTVVESHGQDEGVPKVYLSLRGSGR
jgi:hypothetical protein